MTNYNDKKSKIKSLIDGDQKKLIETRDKFYKKNQDLKTEIDKEKI